MNLSLDSATNNTGAPQRNGDDDDRLYLQLRGGLASVSAQLFGHQRWLEQTLAELIFSPGQLVAVACDASHLGVGQLPEGYSGRLGRYLNGRVQVTVGGLEALVEFLPVANGAYSLLTGHLEDQTGLSIPRTEFVSLDRLTLRAPVAWMEEEPHSSPFHVSRILSERPDQLPRRLHELIEAGQLLEYHSSLECPLELSVVRIAATFRGLVQMEVVGNEDVIFFDHITSWRCHPLGWCSRQALQCAYRLMNEAPTADDESDMIAPACLFQYRPLRDHGMEPGMLLEMIDSISRMAIRPALVTRVLNRHFYYVEAVERLPAEALIATTSEALSQRGEILCHTASNDLFPIGFAVRNQLRLTAPRGMVEYISGDGNSSTTASSPFTYSHLRKLLKLRASRGPTPLPHMCAAPEALFKNLKNGHSAGEKSASVVEKGRWVKLQHGRNPMLFYPALIVRANRHLIWLHSEIYEETGADGSYAPPKIYSIRSPQIHRWDYPSSANLINIFPTSMQASRQQPFLYRFDLTSMFTCQRTAIFRENKKKFLPATWFKSRENLWIPAIYANVNCFCGPFLSEAKVRLLAGRHYGPGPLPIVAEALLKDLLSAGNRPSQIIELLQASDKHGAIPKLQVKLRQTASRRVRAMVEICERASEFPGWLRSILAQLDACPGLMNMERTQAGRRPAPIDVLSTSGGPGNNCKWNCAAVVRQCGWMRYDEHVNTAPPLTAPQQQRLITCQASAKRRELHRYPRGGKVRKVEGSSPPTHSNLAPRLDYGGKNSANEDGGEHSYSSSPTTSSDGGEAEGSEADERSQLAHTDAPSSSLPSTSSNLFPAYPTTPTMSIMHASSGALLPAIVGNPRGWTREELAGWIRDAGLTEIATRLHDEEVDGEAVVMFNQETFRKLGLKLGPELKLQSLVEKLKWAVAQEESAAERSS